MGSDLTIFQPSNQQIPPLARELGAATLEQRAMAFIVGQLDDVEREGGWEAGTWKW